MHGAVLRGSGSARIFSSGISGSWALTMSTYPADVTTQKRDMPHTGLNLSAVSWSRDFPTPNMSINCFGDSGVLAGHSLLPIPPAIITT